MSLATLNTLAYDTWEPGLNDQLEREDGSLYAFLKKTNKDVRGRKVFLKLQSGRPTGVSNIDEGATFPTPGDATYSEAQLTLSRLAATVEFTLEEMDLLDGSDAAALPVVEHKLTELTNALRRDLIRQSWGDGTAILARAAVTTASTTLNLQTTTTNQYDRDRGNWLEPGGMLISGVNATTGTAAFTSNTITNNATDFSTLTVGSAVTTATTDVIVRAGNAFNNAGAYTSREFPGISAAVDSTGTYLTINRTSTNTFWRSTKVTGTTPGTPEPITLNRILKLLNSVHKRTGLQPSPKDYCFFSNLAVLGAYGEYIQTGVRYGKGDTLDVGWPSLEVFGMMFYGDVHAPHNRLYLINKSKFEYRRPKYDDRGLFQFQNRDGSIFRYVADSATDGYKAKVQAHMTGLMTLVTERPNAHGLLDDITESTNFY